MLKANQIQSTYARPTSVIWQLLDWIFPPFCCNCCQIGYEICPQCFSQIPVLTGKQTCSICGKVIQSGSVCTDCLQKRPAFDQLKAWAAYQGITQTIIKQIKYGRRIGLVPYLAQPLAKTIRGWGLKLDFLVPVPLGKQRRRNRGFNQSELIARAIAKMIDIPVRPNALARIRETRTQVGLAAEERKTNIKDAFQADPAICKGKTILLIDDIATTGATLNECAKTIRQVGAENVYCFTVARTMFVPNPNTQIMEVRNE